jgi:hypothetical protein
MFIGSEDVTWKLLSGERVCLRPKKTIDMWVQRLQVNLDSGRTIKSTSIDRWLGVSARSAKKSGMPKSRLFKLKPVDGNYDIQTPQGGLEVYAFDWREGMQY